MAPGGDGAGVCRAGPVAALLGPFAELDNVSRASPSRALGGQRPGHGRASR